MRRFAYNWLVLSSAQPDESVEFFVCRAYGEVDVCEASSKCTKNPRESAAMLAGTCLCLIAFISRFKLTPQKRMPNIGWSNATIELVLQEIALMDSNNFESILK